MGQHPEHPDGNYLSSEPLKERPCKILVVSDYMPPQTHGIATHSKDLVYWLRQVGCIVHVFTTCGEPSEFSSLLLSFRNPFNPLVRTAMLPSFKLVWTILAGDWDVVHVLYPSLIGWPVLMLAWLAGKTTYVSHHCNEELGRLYLPEIIYLCCFTISVLIAGIPAFLFATINAGATEGYLQEHYFWRRLPSDRVAVVPSSVNSELFHANNRTADSLALRQRLGLSNDQAVWLVVARLAVEKRVNQVIEALQLSAGSPVLVIAGDGPERSRLEQQAKDAGLGDRVHFLGFVPHREVPTLYRACDACVTCSVQETFGLTVIESMACGCPQVLPHCPVFDELYGNVISDWMYTAEDSKSLARTMEVASRSSSALHLEKLKREGAFGAHIFWSWRDAALEQVEQYRSGQSLLNLGRFYCCVRRRDYRKSADIEADGASTGLI